MGFFDGMKNVIATIVLIGILGFFKVLIGFEAAVLIGLGFIWQLANEAAQKGSK